MKSIAPVLAALFLFLAVSGVSHAAPLKTFVTEFSVSGVPDKDELKITLQGLLASRLNPEHAQLVESRDKAELTVAGSYARFGKTFSLDVLLKNVRNGSFVKVFEQGEGEDDLFPAIGRLMQKIDRELVKSSAPAPLAAAPTVAVPAIVAPLPATVPTQQQGYQVAPETKTKDSAASPVIIPTQPDAYLVRPDESAKDVPGSWTSPAMEGAFSGIALGRTFPNGEREIFVAGERVIRYYLKGAGLKLVSEISIATPSKILSIDTADLDGDGVPELYVTIFDRETLVSQVYLPTEKGLEKSAENLPWFFRGIGPDLKSRSMYAQEMKTGGEFFGAVATVVKNGATFSLNSPRKLPRSGYIFNFNQLENTAEKGYFVVLNEDGHLVVSAPDGEEAWKSSEKYGGSETNFKVETTEQRHSMGDALRWTFLEQRIVITPDGTLLVPHNEGLFNVGNNRSYTKYSLHALTWNGSTLKEKWHTRLNQSYLADFAYDAAARELVLLEVVQKAEFFTKGKTVISINRID